MEKNILKRAGKILLEVPGQDLGEVHSKYMYSAQVDTEQRPEGSEDVLHILEKSVPGRGNAEPLYGS